MVFVLTEMKPHFHYLFRDAANGNLSDEKIILAISKCNQDQKTFEHKISYFFPIGKINVIAVSQQGILKKTVLLVHPETNIKDKRKNSFPATRKT